MQIVESYHSLANVNVLPKMAMVLTIAVGARLTEGRGETREGRLKGSNHKEQEQRRFVGTLYITPPSPGTFCLLVSLKILTHVCFRYLIPNGKTNVPEELPPPAEAYYKQNTLGSKSESDKLICNTSNAF